MVNTNGTQSFGSDPIKIRETNHYKKEYIKPFVEKWDELIDWEKRADGEGSFFIEQLKLRGAKKVLDAATGTGFHSARLLKAGFDVISVDGSANMLMKAFENVKKYGFVLKAVHTDWRSLSRYIDGKVDAIVCLGNSFTHIFSERDRRKALAEFYSVLKHDGVLILDQRNYDTIIDEGFSSKHKYHYCGQDVTAEPEYVDEGLARFKYTFSDNSVYHLNMFPLRKKYVRKLMKEVGFQHIDTYGDYKEKYKENDPDFFTHIAEKYYRPGQKASDKVVYNYSDTVKTAKTYYDSQDADNFYFTVWGGEDIHIGLYESEDESIYIGSRRTIEQMASRLKITPDTNILDLGAGYGGAARFLSRTYGCRVTALNLSETENQRSRKINNAQGLTHLVEVIDASFEDVPYPDSSFDIIWSQDAILHSGERENVIEEAARLLKDGGEFLFTDPMQADDCPINVLQPILDRIHLETLGSPKFYAATAKRFGLRQISFENHTPQLIAHYSKVLQETERRESELIQIVSKEYIENMKKGLNYWIDGGKKGYLVWGIFHFRKEE